MPSLSNANKSIILNKINEVSQFTNTKLYLLLLLKEYFYQKKFYYLTETNPNLFKKIKNIGYIIGYKYADNYNFRSK